jgi:molybdate transport system substrate-binding protein
VFQRLGIAAQVTPKVKLTAGGPNGRVSVLVSSGEAEIGLQQVSELMSNPEVEVIGMLPAELQQITVYSAGVTASSRPPRLAACGSTVEFHGTVPSASVACVVSREAEAAKSLIKALTAPSAAPIYKAKGLDPA